MNDQKNTILAIVLSALVLIVWQVYFGVPQMEKQKQIQQQQAQERSQQPPALPPQTPGAVPQTPPAPGTAPQAPAQGGTVAPQTMSRDAALAASPRVRIETPSLSGSISLKGGRIDDLSLVKYRETVDPNSPPIVLLAPSGSPHPFYAEFGWSAPSGPSVKLPDSDTLWQQQGSGTLSVGRPVTLVYDNGQGLQFRRTIAVDDKYLFTLKDEVINNGAAPVTLYPYALISRHGTPQTLGYYILHEGLIGVFGDKGLQEETYANIEKQKAISFTATNVWLGITDKYWAATLLPDTKTQVQAKFSTSTIGNNIKTYQSDYLGPAQTIAPGAAVTVDGRLFAGAKEVSVVDGYDQQLGLNKFDRLIDWGWFYFITKPLFLAMDWIYRHVGNFGVAILIVTVIIKIFFFPLANKSYASMAKMKAVQPEMMAIRERFADDKMKQQQAMMELYKKEKINPIAGCLPIVIQIPVFFALYKVLFVTIEMRHAPFFGWIKDLAAPDPTTVFNLFGLIPWDPSHVPLLGPFLMLGIWPLIMGVTMWFQMKLNPPPPDPTQAMIFNYMPIIFTFMLASFPAGLVIYWAWNNTLSVTQQSVIMHKHGAKIELWDNLKSTWESLKGLFKKKSDPGVSGSSS
ncbi:MAG TPA: membrane protein insertase YidC [Xanthobacteraceae bacterium]|nr:membrane protein insertase YidC [Xanthobacteraceae bacterium]